MRSWAGRSAAISAYHEAALLLASARVRVSRSSPRRSATAVVAARSRANGLSRGAELQQAALERAGANGVAIDVDPSPWRLARHVPHVPASTYVFHAAAPETALLINAVLPECAGARRIGYWAWELPDPPPSWKRYEQLVSEVWAPSTFAADSLRKMLSVPVHVVPHRVEPQERRCRVPGAPFRVLTLADGRSSFSRKNPEGAIACFVKAFGGSPAAQLTVKLSGRREDAERIIGAAAGQPNIEFIVERLDDAGMTRLFRSADCLLSLHRAEGFGLPMLESMAHGVPVVGTGWSGNCDYMTRSNSSLVPYELVPVLDESGVYPSACSHWAEPDVEAAAAMLRDLAFNAAAYDAMSRAAHRSVEELAPLLPLAGREEHLRGDRSQQFVDGSGSQPT